MNFFKVYAVSFIVLFICTLQSDGLFMGLLIQLIALKGALFMGTPIALGAFVMGQGLGFIGGNMMGGYTMLKAAQRFHDYEKVKWTSSYGYPATSHKGHGHSHTSYGYGDAYSDGYGHSVITHDTGYVPVTPVHSKGINKYNKGFNKGIFLGAGLKGFREGLRHPYGGTPLYGSSHHSHGHDHGYGGYGYESIQQPAHYHPTPNNHIKRVPAPSLFQRFTSIFKPKAVTKPKVVVKAKPTTLKPSYHQNSYPTEEKVVPYYEEYSSDPSGAAHYGGAHHVHEGVHHVHDGAVHEYSSVVSGDAPGLVVSDGYEVPSDGSAVSVHSEPAYSNQEYEIVKSYEGQDTPKSEPMGPGYLTTDYESTLQQGIPSHDLSDSFSSFYPGKPNEYGTPIGEPMGTQEYTSYHSASEPLEVQASVAYDLSSEFEPSSLKKFGKLGPKPSESIRSSKKVPAPNFVLEKYLEEKLEEKAQKARGALEKKEARHLIGLLRQAYIQQLIDSVNAGKKESEKSDVLPNFKPFPGEPNSSTEPTTSTQSDYSTASTTITKSWDKTEDYIRSRRHSVPTAATTPATTSSPPEPAMDPKNQEKFVATFVEDVKSFFVLVSALDQDTCLQKLVCDVHSRAHEPDLTPYESNIIGTFRIMDTLIPENSEDSSASYRRAARIGEIGSSPEICKNSYTNCGYSASQIINLGKQVENVGSASNLNTQVYGEVDNLATAMPRV